MSILSQIAASKVARASLAAMIALPLVAAPAMAGERVTVIDKYGQDSRRVFRDDIGRFYLGDHGKRIYIQYFKRDAKPDWRNDRDNRRDWRDDRRDPRKPWQEVRRDNRRDDHRDDRTGDAALAAGIAGLAIGAIIAGINNQPQSQVIVRDPYPTGTVAPRTFPAAPVAQPMPSGPKVITYDTNLEPWSAGWQEWCAAKYRSFNPARGTYRGYDGLDHFCVVK